MAHYLPPVVNAFMNTWYVVVNARMEILYGLCGFLFFSLPFVIMGFLLPLAMKKMIEKFKINKRRMLIYILIYLLFLMVSFFFIQVIHVHPEDSFPEWVLILMSPLMPAYTIAFAGNLFLFMRWNRALGAHLLVFLLSFGLPSLGLMALVLCLPINMIYYAAMIYWSRKSLYPTAEGW
ncbi:hypothetical protein [Dyella caseinilytica]|uniref:Uncharacterized protein n=1 Tax=Dyella caseinilytica TaxID=1849581 RepID=A0ABX7GWD4_9GAMM|nr:hypothetical protein [Dyella caseinilytica]QRN54316.1 hypothetical protein ISN74_02705 [Dyella caseinilytica]